VVKPLVIGLPAIDNVSEMRFYLRGMFHKIGWARAEKRETDILLVIRPINLSARRQYRLYWAITKFKHEVSPHQVTVRLDISHLLPKPPYWRTSFIAAS